MILFVIVVFVFDDDNIVYNYIFVLIDVVLNDVVFVIKIELIMVNIIN